MTGWGMESISGKTAIPELTNGQQESIRNEIGVIEGIKYAQLQATFNGEECYYVSGTQNILPNTGMYVDKDTRALLNGIKKHLRK